MSLGPPPPSGKRGIPTRITRFSQKLETAPLPNQQISTNTLYAAPLSSTGRNAPTGAIPRPRTSTAGGRIPQPAPGRRIPQPSSSARSYGQPTSSRVGLPAPRSSQMSQKQAVKIISSTTSITSENATGRITKTRIEAPSAAAAGKYMMQMQQNPRSQQGKRTLYANPQDDHRGRDYKSSQDSRNPMKRSSAYEGLPSSSAYMGGSGSSQGPYSQDRQHQMERQMDLSTTDECPQQSELQQQITKELLKSNEMCPDKMLKAMGARQNVVRPRKIMTDDGEVLTSAEISTSKTVIRTPGKPEILAKQLTSVETLNVNEALRTELDIQKIAPLPKRGFPSAVRETINITNTLSKGPGVKQTSKCVTYETDKLQEKEDPPDPQQVLRLVQEESADVDRTRGLPVPDLKVSRPTTYGIRKNVELLQLNPDSVSVLEQSVGMYHPTADEEQAEPNPELLASMLNTEERGLTMDSTPKDMYNYLFADNKMDPVIDVSSAAPVPLQDIVVPANIPSQVEEMATTPDVLKATVKAETNSSGLISDATYTAANGFEPIRSKNVARKGKKRNTNMLPLLTQEIPPWGIEDLDPIVEVVGAPPANTFIATENQDDSPELDPVVDGIEYLLHLEPPQHSSRVQLRGSQRPPWFPGYVVALPDLPDVIQLVKSPSAVFQAAWKATQPDIFSDKSLFII